MVFGSCHGERLIAVIGAPRIVVHLGDEDQVGSAGSGSSSGKSNGNGCMSPICHLVVDMSTRR